VIYSYDEVRPLLATGQIVGVRERHSIAHVLTNLFTGTRYTHVGMISIKECGVYLAELNGGRNHLIPLSQLKDKRFDIYECPEECLPYIDQSIEDALREEIPYGFFAFILIGLMDLFNISIKLKGKKLLVCSGFVVSILRRAGWKKEVSTLISPGDLLEHFKFLYQVNK